MDVPTSWLVRPREALYDLDNIQLGSLSPEDQSVDAVFDLDYLVVEGHAREGNTKPPRGVQLQLITKDGNPIDDTQVVANLGYLQFKAKPGVFRLEIRDGRGRDIYQMDSVGNEGWDSPSVEEVGSEITVTSFEGLTLYPRLSRKYGMEMADVLEELEETKPGIFERCGWISILPCGASDNHDSESSPSLNLRKNLPMQRQRSLSKQRLIFSLSPLDCYTRFVLSHRISFRVSSSIVISDLFPS